ncbi:MAG: TIGR02391 family protein [Rhizobiales bacterium]|nr:TIGR02391 family protein [Hyphomicrobiales bacterium]
MLFHRAQYDTAVFVAMKGVEIAVREASGLTSELGVALMRKAFDKNSGPLRDVNALEGEREARAHFFAGAIGSYKNPHSHRNVALDDADEAAEIITLANHLLRIVEGISKSD